MTRRKNEFREEDKIAALLWCQRHCCLCGKQVGLDIEIAHLDPKKSDIDNAMPACFRCHAEIGRYNPAHPKGRSYKIEELKARRDQVYEEHTRHLVPVLKYMVHKNGRTLPMVGFTLIHTGNAPQVTAFVRLDTYVNGLVEDRPDQYDLYRGKIPWNLNPGEGVDGQFVLPESCCSPETDVRVGVNITIHDIYGRAHVLLPVTYVLLKDPERWYLDPIKPETSAAQAQRSE